MLSALNILIQYPVSQQTPMVTQHLMQTLLIQVTSETTCNIISRYLPYFALGLLRGWLHQGFNPEPLIFPYETQVTIPLHQPPTSPRSTILDRTQARCRLCKDAPEMVQHILAGCKMQAAKTYMEHHT